MEEMALFGETFPAAKRFKAGTHRSCTPEETLERFVPDLSRYGITRLANVTGLDVIGIPTWVSVRPNARGLSTSQGKGMTDAAAKASAIMESIETWHAENIDLPVRHESHAALTRSDNAIPLSSLSYYADSPPRADMPMAWVKGEDLMSGQNVWVPLEAVTTNYVVGPRGMLETSFVQSSNGLAGGNTVPEAVAHALAELIERDEITRTAQAFRAMDIDLRVDLSSVRDAECQALLNRLEAADMQIVLMDLTGPSGIPVYGAVIAEKEGSSMWRRLPPFSGYGCHPSAIVAVMRALTEAVQSRVTHISGSRDDISYSEYARAGHADDLASFHARAGEVKGRPFDETMGCATDSFAGDIATLLSKLRDHGIEHAVAVDLRKPDRQVPVVKLVVPGLAAPTPLIRGRQIVSPTATTERVAA